MTFLVIALFSYRLVNTPTLSAFQRRLQVFYTVSGKKVPLYFLP